MNALKTARRICIEHPVFWLAIGLPLFIHLSSLPTNSWNVEMNIARNLIDGYGFVDAPLDPPALWRPPLAVALLVPIEMLVRDPIWIYSIFGALTLLGFMSSVFYLMKMLGGNVAAHSSMLLVLSTPAFTSLLAHQLQLLSYLLIFSLVTLSILATIWAWRRSSWRRDIVVGLSWGIAFLARPEAILLLAASLFAGVLLHRYLGIAPRRAVCSLLMQLAAFLLIYGPSVAVFQLTQQRHHLYGQESLFTYYAGAHFASNQFAGDIDGEGYQESLERFGSPEQYQNSMLRFMIAQPQAIAERVSQNLSNFERLVESNVVVNFWTCLAFLIFSSILASAKPPPIPGRILVFYLTLLLLASPYFLIFHVDTRYTLLFTVVLVLWIWTVSMVVWTAIGGRLRLHWAVKWIPAAGLVFLCVNNVNAAIDRAGEMEVDMTSWQQLATDFRSKIKLEQTPVVGFLSPEGVSILGGDFYWFSYYARTALPWCGDPNCDAGSAFPRSRIYSFLGKPLDYLWVPDDHVPKVEGSPRIVMQHVPAGGFGCYSLLKFKRDASDRTAADAPAPDSQTSCEGGFSARFVDRTDIDKVACEALGLHPDGKADGLLEVQIPGTYRAPRTMNWLSMQSRPLYMNLQRSLPPGTFETNNVNFILGVSKTPDGPLLNRSNGTVPADMKSSKLYFHYCRDDGDYDAGSTYQVRIGNTVFPVAKQVQ
jgi:hypothetical protein